MTGSEQKTDGASDGFLLEETIMEEVLFLIKIGMGLLASPLLDGQLRVQFEQGAIWYYLKAAARSPVEADQQANGILTGLCCSPEDWNQFICVLRRRGASMVWNRNTIETDCHIPIPAGQERFYQAAVLERLQTLHANLKGPCCHSGKQSLLQ